MSETPRGWTVFESDTPVLTYTYTFGPGRVTALAVGGARGLFVFSPPYRAPANAFDELRDYGEVSALVASNAFHHMGIPEWKARFPEAAVFAPAQAVGRIRKQSGIQEVAPYSEAAPRLGERLDIVDMPHYRTGEALTRIRTTRGLAWYVVDIILNVRDMPKNPLLYLLFRMTASAPGLRWNKVGPTLMVKDRAALKRWMRDEFERAPPRWLIPTHGSICDFEAEAHAARKLFDF